MNFIDIIALCICKLVSKTNNILNCPNCRNTIKKLEETNLNNLNKIVRLNCIPAIYSIIIISYLFFN